MTPVRRLALVQICFDMMIVPPVDNAGFAELACQKDDVKLFLDGGTAKYLLQVLSTHEILTDVPAPPLGQQWFLYFLQERGRSRAFIATNDEDRLVLPVSVL